MRKPWEAERRVDVDLARGLVRECSGEEPATIELLGEGWDNVAYLVDDTWVYRFPRGEAQVAYLEAECEFLPLVAGRLPLPVSVAEMVGAPTAAYPLPFARHRYVPGITAERARLTDAGRRALAPPLGAFLRALHDLDAKGLPGDLIGRMDHGKRAPAARERLGQLAALGVIADVSPWLPLLGSLPRSPLPSCALHGDFYCRQIVLGEDRSLKAVIDWGDIHRGDPACDLMVAFAFVPRAEFEKGYGPIDEATAARARFRALSHTLGVTLYARDIGDADLLREGCAALARLA
ncbi:MAG TPA: phosphotransferase [Planctomycetota bacterium]|nr:phosphotransferase [Planctomycetota bacterium]